MNQKPFRLNPAYFLVALLLLVGALISVSFFERIPIEGTMLAIDWKNLYSGIQGGQIIYRGGSLMIAPWSLPAVLPLGFFSMRAGWGLLALTTIGVLVLSVPRRRYRIAATLLLVTSWPAIRQVVDGNFEYVVIAGVLLIIYGLRGTWQHYLVALVAGLLMASAKPQEVWLLMIVLGFYLLRTRSLQRLFELGTTLLIVVVPALVLFGMSWISAMRDIQPPPGTILDISLWAALARLGIGPIPAALIWLVIFVTTLYVTLGAKPAMSREKASLLIAMSLLLAPYAAGDSFLTVLAIGIIPTFQARPRLGLALIALTDLQYILPRDFLYWYGAWYWTAMLLLVGGLWTWQIYQAEGRHPVLEKELIPG